MGIKGSLQSNELIYAWASKLEDKGSLSNTGSKVHGCGSLYQTWVRVTKIQIIYYIYRMEELITLYFSNFAILGERATDFAWHTSCSNHDADRTLRSQIFLNELKREHPARLLLTGKSRTLLTGASAPLCNLHEEERVSKALQKMTGWGNWRSSPWTSLCEGSLRCHWWCHYPSGQKGYQGEWTLASSVLSHHQHDDCMRELQQELNRCMVRACLQGELSLTRTSMSRRCSQGHSALQTWSWVREAAKQPREDSPTEWSGSWKWHSQLRGRSRSMWHQSPSPECQRQSLSSSPSPLGMVIPASDCVSIWETWSYRPGLRSPGVGHGKVGPNPSQRKPQDAGPIWHQWRTG